VITLELEEIFNSIKTGKITSAQARKLLSLYSIQKIENLAKMDIDRKKRRGIPEVVFAENKEFNDIKKIVESVLRKSNSVLISRLKKKDNLKLRSYAKKSKLRSSVGRNSSSILLYKKTIKNYGGKVGILSAGTSDIGIAEEARLMCESMHCKCLCSYDVGVAGMHRLFPILKKFISNDVDAVIVIAGMEGALPTLVSSLVDIPVIGVPTSIGYGYGEKGIGALAAMLQSCSLGLSVVNIDNGIGAGAVAANIANRANRKKIK